MIIKDDGSGQVLFHCELPDDFEITATKKLETFPDNQRFSIAFSCRRGNCEIRYQTGESYVYGKKKVEVYTYVPVPEEKQTSSGSFRAVPVSLKEEIDLNASKIAGKKIEGKDYLDLSENMKKRLDAEFRKMVDMYVHNVSMLASFQPIAVGTDIRNYLYDGAIGIYEDGERILAVCLCRMGIEADVVQRSGIYEDLCNEPFGKAPDSMYAAASTCEWSIPFICSMTSENKSDLKIFMELLDSLEKNEELAKQTDELAAAVSQYCLNKARNEAMQQQAMWNMAFANQQQQFAAMDRLTQSIHQDLDSFHNGLFAQMNQNDMRINTGPQAESSDDYIQRLRHESMMGVDTYERNDGSTVEYSTMADRVFENNLDQTTHFGTHHYYDDYIPEGWHELKKK